jgi:hypothetical protein
MKFSIRHEVGLSINRITSAKDKSEKIAANTKAWPVSLGSSFLFLFARSETVQSFVTRLVFLHTDLEWRQHDNQHIVTHPEEGGRGEVPVLPGHEHHLSERGSRGRMEVGDLL